MHDSGHGQHDGSLDPHIWLSPENAAAIAANIRDGLVSVDPVAAAYYDSNLVHLRSELREVDLELRTLLGPFAGRSFYVFHPAFGYFAERYGLEQVAIEVDGKEPGARDLVAVVTAARDAGVKVILVQPQHPASIARTVASEIGAELVIVDPLAYDYTKELVAIGRAVAGALERKSEAPDE